MCTTRRHMRSLFTIRTLYPSYTILSRIEQRHLASKNIMGYLLTTASIGSSPGFEKHHGLLDVWAQHNLPRSMYSGAMHHRSL